MNATVTVLAKDADKCWVSDSGRCWYIDDDSDDVVWCALFDSPLPLGSDGLFRRCSSCKLVAEPVVQPIDERHA